MMRQKKEAALAGISARIVLLKQRKANALEYLRTLDSLRTLQRISGKEYLDRQNAFLGKKPEEEYFSQIERQLEQQRMQLETLAAKESNDPLNWLDKNKHALFLFLFIFAIFFAAFFLRMYAPTGFVAYERQKESTLFLNLSLNESQAIELNLSRLLSLKVSGNLTGNGSARIYLTTPEKRYLVFDSAQQNRSKKISGKERHAPITGFAVYEDDITDNSTPENMSAIILPETVLNGTLLNETILRIGNDTPDISLNASLNEPADETVNELANETLDETALNITPENLTPEEISVWEILFDRACLETCILDNISNVSLEIELNGVFLYLESLTYTFLEQNHLPVQLHAIPDFSFAEEMSLNISNFFTDPDQDNLSVSLEPNPYIRLKQR
ncbi:MAG: hypothetical protein V1743_01635, partial [Nanoarchaeota archaeon]